MYDKLVSVVIPVYNVEKYLDRCIESIVNQTYRNLEIILVDDGSPDNCPEMCDNWAEKDNRIKVIHKKNAGLGMARNSGIEAATGTYILFIDSDDYIDLSTVEKCVCESEHDKNDIVVFGMCDAFADGTVAEHPIKTGACKFTGKQIIDEILPQLFTNETGADISVCNKMYRLELIKNNGVRFYSEREFLSEDAVFNLEIFKYTESVSFVPEIFYYYYKNEKSLTHTYKEDLQELNNNFLGKCLQLCDKYNYNNHIKNSICSRYHSYSVAGMKQISSCDLSNKQKKDLLYNFFNDRLFRDSITSETYKFKSVPLRIFFLCIKLKLYRICCILLKLSINGVL